MGYGLWYIVFLNEFLVFGIEGLGLLGEVGWFV